MPPVKAMPSTEVEDQQNILQKVIVSTGKAILDTRKMIPLIDKHHKSQEIVASEHSEEQVLSEFEMAIIAECKKRGMDDCEIQKWISEI